MLDDAVKAHKPHPKSLKDEASTEAYNEQDARRAFGNEFIDKLKKDQGKFKGDWWQLALLVKNLWVNEQNPEIEDKYRLGAWNKWRRGQPYVGHPDYELPHLEHAILREAHLERAYLKHAHLEHASLEWAYLEHAILRAAHLEHVKLEAAHLEHADLAAAHLEHAELYTAHLENANLRWAHLEHANLHSADFERADVRGVAGLRFNGNRVVGIRIEGNAPDPWSVLRCKYTGPWFFFHLLLLAIFFAPYVGHALYLTAESQFQAWSMEQYNALGERAGDVPWLSDYLAKRQRRFFEEHEQRRAVWVLLGVHRGILPIVLAAIVVLYNVGRGFLTLRVSLLRDAEERSNITPDWNEYKWLHRTHWVARILFLVALAAVVSNTYLWGHTTWIWVPVGP